MKSCPTCNKTFTDPNLSFCIDDGTPLVPVAEPKDETTVVSPSSGENHGSPPPTEVYKPRDWQAPDYQPPGFETSTPLPERKKTWPWVVGVLCVALLGVIGIGIAGMIAFRQLRPDGNRPSSNPGVGRRTDPNINLNSNSGVSNSNAPVPNASSPASDSNAAVPQPNNENGAPSDGDDDESPPPTDKDAVLAALTDLEHEWTVANINADKQELNRILADDYVGVTEGKSQGKVEYLRSIQRDTTIQNWKFEKLNVKLMRDRATLEGVLRIQLPDRAAAFKFADKFVWRDGRWQAVSSEVSQLE